MGDAVRCAVCATLACNLDRVRLLRSLCEQLMEDDLSVVFHEPVDVEAYPSYAEKVDEPMDFGTIKSKLDNWEYRRNDPLGFQRDVRLVSDRLMAHRVIR